MVLQMYAVDSQTDVRQHHRLMPLPTRAEESENFDDRYYVISSDVIISVVTVPLTSSTYSK